MGKNSAAGGWVIVLLAAVALRVASAVSGYVLWRAGHDVIFWVFVAILAYLAVAGAVSAKRAPTKKPWENYRGVWTVPPLKIRQALRRTCDEEHPDAT